MLEHSRLRYYFPTSSATGTRTLAQHGVLIRQAGVESPEQIGRVERHGGLFKEVLKRMITEHTVQGFDDIKNRDH